MSSKVNKFVLRLILSHLLSSDAAALMRGTCMMSGIEEDLYSNTHEKADMITAADGDNILFGPRNIVQCVGIEVNRHTSIRAVVLLPDHF